MMNENPAWAVGRGGTIPSGSPDVPASLATSNLSIAELGLRLGRLPHSFPFLALYPFTTPGEEWVTLIDDSDAECKQRTLTNNSDTEMVFEVTWAYRMPPTVRYTLPPRSSMLIECGVAVLRVVGSAGGCGTWGENDDPPSVRFAGSGVVFAHGGDHLDGWLQCRTFRVRNQGWKKITVKMRRAAPDAPAGTADADSTHTIQPGNTLTLRCEIGNLEIERTTGDERGYTSIEEVRS